MKTALLPFTIRPAEACDQAVLWDVLYEALWDPPCKPRRPRSVLSLPHIAVYVENWGWKPTDLGFLAITQAGSVAGGVLGRLLSPPLQGGAFFDEHTPQVGIAVFPAFRNQGIGANLFRRYLSEASSRLTQVSLSVHRETISPSACTVPLAFRSLPPAREDTSTW